MSDFVEIERKSCWIRTENRLTVIELIRKIADYIFADRKRVKERLGDIMGGKVLELETDKLIKIGEEKGIETSYEKSSIN